MKQVSIQREIETDGAYGCRQIIVEVNAVFERFLITTHPDDTRAHYAYELDSMEVLDENGKDITDTISPSNKEYLEKQVMDAR